MRKAHWWWLLKLKTHRKGFPGGIYSPFAQPRSWESQEIYQKNGVPSRTWQLLCGGEAEAHGFCDSHGVFCLHLKESEAHACNLAPEAQTGGLIQRSIPTQTTPPKRKEKCL